MSKGEMVYSVEETIKLTDRIFKILRWSKPRLMVQTATIKEIGVRKVAKTVRFTVTLADGTDIHVDPADIEKLN